MRLFVTVELPEGALEALAETSALLRESVRGRFVASDSFHVTLFRSDLSGPRPIYEAIHTVRLVP